MAVTKLADVASQVQEFWSPLFAEELRESLLLGAKVDKAYEGEIKQKGDTVKVSQINAPAGSLKTVGVDADTFDTETLSTTQIEIKADKRAVAAYEFEDLVQLQSQIGEKDSAIRQSLLYAVEKQINDYLYSLVAPSAAAPDHVLGSTATLTAAVLANVRQLAGEAKWLKNKPWHGLVDPQYFADILEATTLTSSDYISGQPVMSGMLGSPRYGFNIMEDNSQSGGTGIFFHPDFMHLVMQQEARFKLSDQHANKRFGYVLSVDLVFGAKQGIDGDKKVIKVSVA